MHAKRIREGVGLALILFSVLILSWGIWPQPKEERVVTILAEEMQTPSGTHTGNSPVTGERVLKLMWPARLRSADNGTIRLSLDTGYTELDKSVSSMLTAQGELDSTGSSDSGAISHVVIEAQLESRGMEVLPKGSINQALLLGQPVVFVWEVKPFEERTLPVVIWLHLRFVPSEGGTETRKLLSAQRFEIQSMRFLGLDGPTARIMGVFGLTLGALFHVEALARWIHSKGRVDSG